MPSLPAPDAAPGLTWLPVVLLALLVPALALAQPTGATDDNLSALARQHLERARARPDLVAAGRELYVHGRRSDGSPLEAERLDAGTLRGAQAACVACHKRSGMGGTEGDLIVPPINGPALYAGTRLRDRVIISMDPRRGRFLNQSHPPYELATLQAAVAAGANASGHLMSPLMPRYRLREGDTEALEAYLDQLSAEVSPGVAPNSVRFATVITPDVDPLRRDAFLRSIRAMFDQKNSNTLPGHRHMIAAAEGMLNFERNWELEVWELQGPPASWGAQLDAYYAKSPVFAIASGIGRGEWSPVQDFCERGGIPCWFPSVINPPADAARQTYGFYFSDGVQLEARVLAAHLATLDHARRPHRVVQVLRDEATAQVAAAAFAAAGEEGWTVEKRVLAPGAAPGEALAGLAAGDALVLWLRPDDLAALPATPAAAGAVFVSTFLSGGESAPLPAAWHARSELVYPYEMPERRLHNMATFHSWIALRQLPLVDEAMQSEVFFSIGYLMFTMTEMLDNLYRDCLVDRGETLVRRRELLRAEEETMVRQSGHPPVASVAAASRLAPGPVFGTDPFGKLAQRTTPAIGEREGTTIYPRLALAVGQRFASRGAYIVRFAGPQGAELHQESEWIVP